VAWATRTRIAQACIGKRLGRKNRKLERDWYVYVHTHVCTRYMGACKRLDNSGHDGSAAPNGVMEVGRRTCIRVHTHNTYTHTHTHHMQSIHKHASERAYWFGIGSGHKRPHTVTHTHTPHTPYTSTHRACILGRFWFEIHMHTHSHTTHTHTHKHLNSHRHSQAL